MNVWAFRFINDTLKSPVLDWLLPPFSDKDYVVIRRWWVFVAAWFFGRREEARLPGRAAAGGRVFEPQHGTGD